MIVDIVHRVLIFVEGHPVRPDPPDAFDFAMKLRFAARELRRERKRFIEKTTVVSWMWRAEIERINLAQMPPADLLAFHKQQ